MTWPTSTSAAPLALARVTKSVAQARTWASDPAGRADLRVAQGLDGVDHDDVGPERYHSLLDSAQLRGLNDEDPGDVGTQTGSPPSDLVGRLLGGHEEAPPARRRHSSHHLEQERGLAGTRLSAEERRRPWQQPSSEHPVELVDARGHGWVSVHIDLCQRERGAAQLAQGPPR